MKVMIVASLAYSLTNFRGTLLRTVRELGHEVVAVAPDDDADVNQALSKWGVRFVRVPMSRTGLNPFEDLRTLAFLVRLLRRERPDLLLTYTQKPNIYGGLAAQLAGTPRFVAMQTGLGYAFIEQGHGIGRLLLRSLVAKLYRLGIRRAKAVVVFNADDAAEMVRLGILRAAQSVIRVPGSGIDLQRFAVSPIPEGSQRFLLIARLLRDKGIPEFVEAARRVKAAFPDVRFQLLGPMDTNPMGITSEELNSWVAEGVVEYLGHTRDVRPFLHNCTTFVLPSSYREGLPRTILEAMAIGRPIITTDAPGCRETVEPGENGFVVPTGDSQALADAMTRIVRDPGLAERMGRRSRELAEKIYDVHKVNARLLRVMDLDGPRFSPADGAPGRPSGLPASSFT